MFFFFYAHATPPDLHSFPTRRSSDLRIYLNDGVSLKYEVRAIPRPAVAALECDQEFPAYTKLKPGRRDRKSTRLNSSHLGISYAVFCLKKKNNRDQICNRNKKESRRL